MRPVGELELVGAGGEPVDLPRTIQSHGLVDLPPFRPSEDGRALEATLRLEGAGPRTLRIAEGTAGHARVEVEGKASAKSALGAAAHILRLEQDLSGFYEQAEEDPALGWAARGAGRIVRSQTVFEDVVKTICTTNCAWSATVRMVGALVQHLGDPAPGAPPDTPLGRAFPTPAALAEAPLDFYTDTVRAGYRGPYLKSLAESVASGEVDLERSGRRDPRRALRRGGRSPAPGPPWRRAVRSRAHHDDARPLLPAHPRLLDAPQVRGGQRAEGEGLDDRAALPSLRPLRRACVLAPA